MPDEPAVLTVEEAAAYLRIGRSACYSAIHAGQVPAYRVGRKLRVSRVALEEALRTGNVNGNGSDQR